jgi:uncharacterized protein
MDRAGAGFGGFQEAEPCRCPVGSRRHAAGCRFAHPVLSCLSWLQKNNRQEASDMAGSAEERIRHLTKGMLRKQLYVVLSKGGATSEQLSAVLPEHLEYMIGLEKRGVLFASGPLGTTPGQPLGDGLTVLRATSEDEARKIASADPFVVKKIRTFEVREWTVMEGSLGVRLNFSDQSLEIA